MNSPLSFFLGQVSGIIGFAVVSRHGYPWWVGALIYLAAGLLDSLRGRK